jgi:subtilisin family serine protease
MKHRLVFVLAALVVLLALPSAATGASASTRYVVALAGTESSDGFTLAGTQQAVAALVTAAGGAVTLDLSKQIGVLVVDSPNALFDETLRASPLVEAAAEDFKWKAMPTTQEAIARGELTVYQGGAPGGGPSGPHADGLESLQWSMQQIRAPQSHAVQAGSPAVEVGIIDSGIDAAHVDLSSNVDCVKARDFVALGPSTSVGTACTDNQFHGTHVAGIVAGAINGVGVVGVAPRVKVIPVKACDTAGFCYSSATAAGITYSGDAELEVINMSFFVDDDELAASTEVKCMSDPQQRAFRVANERALNYARKKGVVPVAAIGNSDLDYATFAEGCTVVPGGSPGVIGTMALGPSKQKASYSSYGVGGVDVAAPGGAGQNGNCTNTVLSSIPGGWGCFQGTSMASPHAAGVVALIVSQFGKLSGGDVKLAPDSAQSRLQSTVVDQGLPGYDECFGHGRIDALRAVTNDTSAVYDATAPFCPEYNE